MAKSPDETDDESARIVATDDGSGRDSPVAATSRRPTLSARLSTPRFMIALGEGSPVGEYEIQSQIGEGAMGTVYSAIQPLIGKTVAIKVLKPELCANQGSIDRFVQEAQAVNRIGHPNIVDVFSLGELPDGRAYFVMEWLRGEDLKARLARGPVSVQDTCDILDGIARALDAAHAKDIVHRDLKPDNVFLHAVDGGPYTVKLLDFGIAKLLRDKNVSEKTQTGNMMGTPRYISPEQARGVDVTHRADVYSLGVMAYEMLAGRPPFQGETAMDLVVSHMHETPPPLSQFARVPRSLEHCTMRMLAKDPAQRPSLAEVRRVLVDPTQRVSRVGLGNTRKRLAIAALSVAIAAAAVITWRMLDSEDDSAQLTTSLPTTSLPTTSLPTAAAVPHPEPTKPPPVIAVSSQKLGPGMIDITVSGARNAVILVDDVEWGRGVSIKVPAESGSHKVTVRAAGREITESIEVDTDKTTHVTLVVPEDAPRIVVRKPGVRRQVAKPVAKPDVKPTKKPIGDDDLMQPKGRR